jgi:hypothetical protein
VGAYQQQGRGEEDHHADDEHPFDVAFLKEVVEESHQERPGNGLGIAAHGQSSKRNEMAESALAITNAMPSGNCRGKYKIGWNC